MAALNLSSPTNLLFIKPETSIKLQPPYCILLQRKDLRFGRRLVLVRSSPATPPGISEKISDSIKAAENLCAEDATSGECVAAWDEVEELSAAASHAREKLKATSDPLENYCKDNPETDECRTYED